MALDTPGFPAELGPIAAARRARHEVYRADTSVDWTYASPPPPLEPGEHTGHYRLGRVTTGPGSPSPPEPIYIQTACM
jgi:putative NADH-flavin reductase